MKTLADIKRSKAIFCPTTNYFSEYIAFKDEQDKVWVIEQCEVDGLSLRWCSGETAEECKIYKDCKIINMADVIKYIFGVENDLSGTGE